MKRQKIIIAIIVPFFLLFFINTVNAGDGSGCKSKGGECQFQECNATGKQDMTPNDCPVDSLGLQWFCCKSASVPTGSCSGKSDGTSCVTDTGAAGNCYGGICIWCAPAGNYCENTSHCCKGLSCVNGTCVGSNAGGNNSGNASSQTNSPTVGGTSTTTSTTAKCSGNFKEIAGVCFPTNTGLSEASVSDILKNTLFWLLGIFGFIGIMGFIISGIQYLTSTGDNEAIETAKRNMKWSIVGIIVALSGYIIILAVDALLRAQTSYF